MLWGLQRVEPQAAYGIAVDRLRRQIHSGLLLPEEKLPAERQLSDEFGISRVTLREALRVLETDRYITVRRGAHGGAFVAEHGKLGSLAARRIAREPASAMRVLEFLCANEKAATELAATRHSMPELKRMRQALGLMGDSASAPLLKQAESLFHLALADASHNPFFANAVSDGISELFLPFAEGDPERARAQTLDRHGDVLKAIEAGNGQAAGEAITVIHEGWWAALRRHSRHAA